MLASVYLTLIMPGCAGPAMLADIISWMMGLLFIIYINAGSEAGCTRAVTMVKTHIDHCE